MGLVTGCREETSEQAAVLHFTYNRFSDLKSRRDRCDCAPTDEDAKRCFILPFDRMVRRTRQPPLSVPCTETMRLRFTEHPAATNPAFKCRPSLRHR